MKPTAETVRPILQYYGAKWVLADWIIQHFPPHEVYVEPFGGSAAVLLKKPRSSVEVYNDLDGRVVNLFRILRERPKELARAVWFTPWSRRELHECACGLDDEADPVESARRLLVFAWQGIGRFAKHSAKGSQWRRSLVHNHAAPWNDLPKRIMRASARLKHVMIECMDAIEVIRRYDSPDTLFYCDPPYPKAVADMRYWQDVPDEYHERLADELKAIRGMAVVSSIKNDMYDRLFPADAGWTVVTRQARTMTGKATVEALYLCPKTSSMLAKSARQKLLPLQ